MDCFWSEFIGLSSARLDKVRNGMIPAGNHLFKVNNRDTRLRCKICGAFCDNSC